MARPEQESEAAAGDGLAAAWETLPASGTCTRCGASIAWVKTVKGRNLPLDRAFQIPLEGNFGLADGVAYYVRDSARMRAFKGTRSEFPIYVAHFATCTGR